MKWGLELWDQFDNLSAHSQRGIEFCEKFSSFIRERCSIESEYAAKLKRLAKSNKLKRKEDENEFTWLGGFYGLVGELHDMAGQHEVIVERLTSSVLKDIQQLMVQLKQDRRKYIQDATKLASNHQAQLALLDRAKKQYEKAYKEAEKAQESYRRADEDIHMTKADVEKARVLMVQKDQTCEGFKNDYAAELLRTNQAQKQHYDTLLPDVYGQLQQSEESRIQKVGELIKRYADTERSVMPIIDKCIDGMLESAESVNVEKDCRAVIEKFKSGFVPPGDIPFENLNPYGKVAGPEPGENQEGLGVLTTTGILQRTDSLRSTGGSVTGKKKSFLRILKSSKNSNGDDNEDFGHLPPNQQKKKLIQRISNVKSALAKVTAERDGLIKMQDVYRQNSALGDPDSLNKLLEENSVKLIQQKELLMKYQDYLADADASRTTQVQDLPWSTGRKPGSLSSSQADSAPNTPEPSTGSNDSSSVSRSIGDVESGDHSTETSSSPEELNDVDNFDEAEVPIIGTCKAQYAFEAPNEDYLSMTDGEEFSILERDQGDGWTRVRRRGVGDEVGFVPTSYIQCHFNTN